MDMRLTVAVIVATLLASCGSSGPPDEFSDRIDLPHCGRVSVTNADPSPSPQEPLDCFQSAFASGDKAELEVEVQTVEGDTVRWWVRSQGTSA